MKHLIFRNGDTIPAIGLGTWKSQEGEAYKAVLTSLEAGYRHIDCAYIYGNQEEIGEAFSDAFKKGILKREELFVTSKLWNSSHLESDAAEEIEKTLAQLKLDYLDLYLMHWPVALKPAVTFPQEDGDFLALAEAPLEQTWRSMESMVHKGQCKHIGVSNYNIATLKAVSSNASIKPEMNQVEMHPFLPQQKLADFCASEEILMTAYSPLGSSDRPERIRKEDDPILLEHEVINEIAKTHNAGPAQILIAWSVQRNIAVIPKSSNPERIKQNLEAGNIELSEEEFSKINAIKASFRYIDGSTWTRGNSPYEMSDLWEYE